MIRTTEQSRDMEEPTNSFSEPKIFKENVEEASVGIFSLNFGYSRDSTAGNKQK